MRAKARAAVVGCGAISAQHLTTLAANARVELVGVCDASPAAAQWTADRYGTKGFADHRTMLDSLNPDVVHVLTPPASHRLIAEEALRGGAHVIVEKPVAADCLELDAMFEVARQSQRWLVENHNYRFNDQVLAIDALIADGTLGEIVGVDVLMALDIAAGSLTRSSGNPTAHLAGGAVRDFLTHLTYLGLWPFAGAPIGEVDARWWNRSGNPYVGMDDLDARLMVGSGVVSLRFSGRAAPDCFRIWVRGTEGCVETDLYQPFLRLETRRGPAQLSPIVNHAVNGLSLAWSGARNLRNKVMQHSPYHGLWTFLDRMYDAVLDGAALPVSEGDVRRVNQVVDRIVASAGAR